MRFVTGLMSSGSKNVAVTNSTINNQTYIENTNGMVFDHIMWEPATAGQVWENGDIVDIFPDRNNAPDHNITIQDSTLHGLRSPTSTAHSDAIQLYNNGQPHTGIKLLRNKFYDNECINLRTNPGDDVTIENNSFGDSYKGISGCGWYAIDVGYANIVARNNTFPGTQEIQETPTTSGIHQAWTNNAGAGFSAGCGSGGASGATMSHNIWTEQKCGTSDKQVSSIKVNSDGSPQSGSPLIDAGDSASYPAADVLGNARYAGLAPDVGAYETGSIGTPPPPPPADTTPPETTITSAPADGESTSASVAFTSSETGSTFECKLDGGSYANCTSPKAYNSLAVGSHTVSVRATDAAGNTDTTPASATWTISTPPPPADTTPPETTITSAPANGTSTSGAFAFNSSEAGSTFECKLDGDAYAACTSPQSYTDVAVGSHTFSVRATDAAGNTDTSPDTATWTISTVPPADTTAPETTITSAPADGTSTSASIAFSSSEAGSTFACKLDSGSYASCTSPKAYNSLATGSHTFSVRATDAAGNTDASPDTATWTISTVPPADTTAPAVTISSKPTSGTVDTTASFGFSGSDDTTPADALTFRCKLDSGSYGSCTSPKGYSGLGVGSHTFSVRATDGAHNQSVAATATWTIVAPDTTDPTVTITSQPSALIPSLSTSASFAFTGDDDTTPANALTFHCTLDGAAAADCTSPAAVDNLGLGLHTFAVTATDAAGNVSAPASASWTVIAVPPPPAPTPDPAPAPVPSTPIPDPTSTPTDTTPPPVAAPLIPPTLSLLKPTSGTRFRSSLKASAAATDDQAVDHVEFWLDSKRFAYDTRAPYAGTLDTDKVKVGNHTLVARAIDNQGLSSSLGTVVQRVTGASTASSKPVQVAATSDDTSTALLATGPKSGTVAIGLTTCGDGQAKVVKTLAVRLSKTGRAGLSVPDGSYCVASVTLTK
ncbi:Ig-like domain-containing protein [Baekduia sp.]|uniref:Ig-like domain-containing protein n=1 Tax=Baekduia sp. TaxID=2600305 RepID=UPI002DF82DC8|nr:Ig-like domain-containing protein [Baekduia sp.]